QIRRPSHVLLREHCITCKAKRPKSSASVIKRPHLSVVWLLKNLPLRAASGFAVCVAAFLFAAEKQDYKEVSAINQSFSRNSLFWKAHSFESS
ncbi:hypothetical protein, partial [Cupriavidus sp. SK-4]|uniref:hypothetical protein n=1 Tax=Cupriavidus sp. SK-4 TaxID=574750 RepID=UPI001F35A17E